MSTEETTEPVFDASSYAVREGDALLHVALRRVHFLPGAEDENWATSVYSFINKHVVRANSLTIHHYELVCWFSEKQQKPFFAGCLQLSFDWLSKSDCNDFLDTVVTLFKNRPARLTKTNWAPNSKPSEDDLRYSYLYIGNRYVNSEDVFSPFVHKMTGTFEGGIDLDDPFWVKHYSLTDTCCYSFAEKVLSKFLDMPVDRDLLATSAWTNYGDFVKSVFDKPQYCRCLLLCRCIPVGRSTCSCARSCTCPEDVES